MGIKYTQVLSDEVSWDYRIESLALGDHGKTEVQEHYGRIARAPDPMTALHIACSVHGIDLVNITLWHIAQGD